MTTTNGGAVQSTRHFLPPTQTDTLATCCAVCLFHDAVCPCIEIEETHSDLLEILKRQCSGTPRAHTAVLWDSPGSYRIHRPRAFSV